MIKLFPFLLVAISIAFSGCGAYTDGTTFYSPPGGQISVDHKVVIPSGGNKKVRFSGTPTQLEVQQPGFKTKYVVWRKSRFNYWTGFELVILPIASALIVAVDDEFIPHAIGISTGSFLFGLGNLVYGKLVAKEMKFDLTPFVKTDDFKSSLSLADLNISPSASNGQKKYYDSEKKYVKGKYRDLQEIETAPFMSEYQLSHWTKSMLTELNLIDTNELNLSRYEDYQLYVNVSAFELHEIELKKKKAFKQATLHIDYKMYGENGQLMIDTTIVSKSGQFLASYPNEYCAHDALDYSILQFLSSKKVSGLLSEDTILPMNSNYIDAEKEVSKKLSYEELQQTLFRLSTNVGESVAMPISKEGHIIVSKHALDLTDSLIIVAPNGDTLKNVQILEESYLKDYAILKIDFPITNPISIKTVDENYIKTLEAVYAVGFHGKFGSLVQAKGMMSAQRNENSYPIYQLDIKSKDLLYPMIFSESGHLLGFVARTVDNREVEGVSFFRPISYTQ